MRVEGFNHVTINVADLARSLRFYVDALGMRLVHRGRRDAYLEWGTAWVCLQERPEHAKIPEAHLGVDHVAFTISEADFNDAVAWLKEKGVTIKKGPMTRGVGRSVYFCDPDGNTLELHTSDLQTRMSVWK
jgi:catechol 2,3-dioxygenase-like lactoylglutathione lyase family enzyme